jgi:ribosomal protein S18 acetylase RimI-like enzyme
VAWADETGAEEVRLSVAEDNAAAIAAYPRNGFWLTGALGDLMADGLRHELLMARPLRRTG